MKELSSKYIKKRYSEGFFKNFGKHIINNNDYFKNSLFQILENRIFLVLKLLIIYEYNTSGVKNKESYIEFFFSDKGFSSINNKYECLDILINSEIAQTYNFVNSFIDRLNRDLENISISLFNLKYTLSINDITKVQSELSDRHYDSSTVIIITFKNRYNLVYKPRNLGIDIFFKEIIGTINKGINEKLFLCAKSINMGKYGWQEYIDTIECTKKTQINKYYERQGANLALVYLLGGIDLHSENIIAHESYPVIIDIETIAQPPIIENLKEKDKLGKFLEKASCQLSNGIYRTGMLSAFDNEGFDFSAFGWDLLTNDDVTCSPLYKGERIKIINNINHVIGGFSKYVNKIRKIIIKKLPFLLKGHNKIEIRYINRATQYYHDIISASLHPNNMINIDKRLKFILKYLKEDNKSKISLLVNSEVEQIWKLNIPKFTTCLDSRDINSCNNVYKNILSRNTIDEIKKMNSKKINISKEEKIILNSYRTSIYNSKIKINAIENEYIKNINNHTITEKINIIYKNIKNDIIQNDKFLTLTSTNTEGKYLSYGLCKGNLYDGLLGISLFFAAYYKMTGNEESINLAKKAFITGEKIIKSEKYDESLFVGRYGIIYTGLLLGNILNDKNYIEGALRDFKSIINSPIYETDLDIISGVSGKLIVCIELNKHTNNKVVKKYIEQYKNILVENYNKYLLKNTNVPTSLKCTGFSHGISGIVFALSKYTNEYKSDHHISNIINKLINKENKYFSKNKNNWNSNKSKKRDYQYSWCYGSPGIMLSRSLMGNITTDKYIKLALKNHDDFIDNTLSDCLCHGNLGNIDILLQLGKIHPDISKLVQKLENKLFINKNKWISGLPLNCLSNGLMTGNAGIGYALLRLSNKDALPSILFLET